MHWEIVEQPRTVYYLWRDGAMIVTAAGGPFEFESREQAQYVADHWDEVRAPTYHEMQALSDVELIARADKARHHHLA